MKKIIVIVILIILIALGWYLARPLFVDDVVDEEAPEGFVLPSEAEIDAMSDAEKEDAEKELVEGFANQETEADEIMPATAVEAQLLLGGTFRDADDFHKGSGEAKILSFDGQTILRLEDFSVTNGPDLFVILVKHPNPTKNDLGDYINLGELKGNIGNQNYAIPAGINLAEYGSVVIYCKAFHTLFSIATLE